MPSQSLSRPIQPFSLQDLVFIEEAFERLLLDYDRVFSAMGVPACLWRRTGEIYKGNREFTELVGVDGYMMRDVSSTVFVIITLFSNGRQGRLCIYELMAEESAVNYWEVCHSQRCVGHSSYPDRNTATLHLIPRRKQC